MVIAKTLGAVHTHTHTYILIQTILQSQNGGNKNTNLKYLGLFGVQKLYIKYRNFKDGLFKNLTYLKSTIFENKLDLRIVRPFCVLKRGREHLNEIKIKVNEIRKERK